MKLVYDCKYKERLVTIITEFYKFYCGDETIQEAVTSCIDGYLQDGLQFVTGSGFMKHTIFSLTLLQSVLRARQGKNRTFQVSEDPDKTLFFSVEVWSNGEKSGTPMFQATLEVTHYEITITCNDDLAFKLVTHLLTKVAFINGPAYLDHVIVDGESHRMAFYIAACFYKLGSDNVGYLTTLDESRDKS